MQIGTHIDMFWILPGELAGMSHPGTAKATYQGLRDTGITGIATLTQGPLPQFVTEEFGFDYIHLPVRDFSAPSPEQINRFVKFCDLNIEKNGAVTAHCRAGIGRTGVMLACYLVHRDEKPHRAIRRVRGVRPGALETPEQENVVFEFAGCS